MAFSYVLKVFDIRLFYYYSTSILFTFHVHITIHIIAYKTLLYQIFTIPEFSTQSDLLSIKTKTYVSKIFVSCDLYSSTSLYIHLYSSIVFNLVFGCSKPKCIYAAWKVSLTCCWSELCRNNSSIISIVKYWWSFFLFYYYFKIYKSMSVSSRHLSTSKCWVI